MVGSLLSPSQWVRTGTANPNDPDGKAHLEGFGVRSAEKLAPDGRVPTR